MSDTGSNDPYDPNRPSQPAPGTPPPPPAAPQWGSNPPAAPDQPGQFGQPQYGQPQYGQPQYGQPQYGQPQYGQPAGSPPPNYLVWAIVSTVLCCLPLGVASIVFAAQVNGKYASGDVAGAQESSARAKKFAIWSAVVGLVVGALYLITFVVLARNSDTSY
ncbi:MAG: CD225/dispanin family protein [Spirochaetaceae bacterium]|nr:CD225/dispanin family protein [Spirochaetaceae bacterium]